MYNRKRIGPKIDPCGAPHSILKKDDEVLFIIQIDIDWISSS